MDKFDRIYQLHTLLRGRKRAISLEELMQRMECSRPTLFRALEALRDRLNAPVVFDEEAGGYRYSDAASGAAFELPGLWFTAQELQALTLVRRLLSDLGSGLLEEHLAPLNKRLDELVQHRRLNLGDVGNRFRFPALAARAPGEAFQGVASATLQRHQLRITYHARGTDVQSVRRISPQRITHYRESWYLDAWDEDKGALRSFSIDRIVSVEGLADTATDISDAELDRHYASAYGIFGGEADKVAVLHFTSERARWVADEEWHPQQSSSRLADGTYELRIPYGDPRELVMDILRHGSHVVVVSPPSLRAEVAEQLAKASEQYRRSDG